MDYLTYKRRMCRRQKHPVLFRILAVLKKLPFMASFRRPPHDLRFLSKGWNLGPLTDHEPLYEQADAYREYLLRLATIRPVNAIPSDIGRVLYDDLKMIDRYDGLLFLTKRGVMYLKSRGLV